MLWFMRLIAGVAALLFCIDFTRELSNPIAGMLFWIMILACRYQGHLEERRDRERVTK
jgi:hypothetical protein